MDEHPFTSYFDVHQGYRVLTHNQIAKCDARKFQHKEFSGPFPSEAIGPKHVQPAVGVGEATTKNHGM